MKTLKQLAGLPKGYKLSTKYTDFTRGNCMHAEKPNRFKRSDGSIGSDKTVVLHSRPLSKQTIRNANRTEQKRGRSLLKKQLTKELYEGYVE